MTAKDDVELPAPPWRPARGPRRPPRKRAPLSKDLIVETALRVVVAEGLDAVTVRRVAEELDTGSASLYTHISGKEELLELVLDLAAAEVTVPRADPDRWIEQVRDVAREYYRVLCAHNDVARVALGAIPTGPNMLRVTEGLLGIMIGAGIPVRTAAWSIDRLLLYVAGDAYQGALLLAHRPPEQPVHEFATRFLGDLRDFYASLPADRFPHTSGNAGTLTQGGGDERFEFGLTLLLDGIARAAAAQRTADPAKARQNRR
ncbi:TetR/AcrR family transcriptional regulator [Streptomyces sp. HPF1205]|uniref:TetR/AcrR family transcriptional regulator n=1 Tax=Streptomyces sp. HPF1205 TaxID=2873262 RepID=UPI001CECF1D9|nr:TetR/AcrR family transcriptional regulator [Streptomyces sp. HPF1205]